jgi:hypothetical protein
MLPLSSPVLREFPDESSPDRDGVDINTISLDEAGEADPDIGIDQGDPGAGDGGHGLGGDADDCAPDDPGVVTTPSCPPGKTQPDGGDAVAAAPDPHPGPRVAHRDVLQFDFGTRRRRPSSG